MKTTEIAVARDLACITFLTSGEWDLGNLRYFIRGLSGSYGLLLDLDDPASKLSADWKSYFNRRGTKRDPWVVSGTTLEVVNLQMSSDGVFSFSGLDGIIREVRELIKDFWFRNWREKELYEVRVETARELHRQESLKGDLLERELQSRELAIEMQELALLERREEISSQLRRRLPNSTLPPQALDKAAETFSDEMGKLELLEIAGHLRDVPENIDDEG